MRRTIGRRKFVKTSTVAGVGHLALPRLAFSGASAAISPVRLGFIGVGFRGRRHLQEVLKRDDVQVNALCDIDPDALERSRAILRDYGAPEPAAYGKGDEDFHNLVQRDDLDAVIVSTPWRWHVPAAVAAMKAGKATGLEVPGATTIEGCWELVRTHQDSGVDCMLLENVCYRRDVLAVLNMVREGLFGELIHCQCGYQHDLRDVKFNDGKQPHGGGVEFGEKGFSEARWRTQHSVLRNGDLYPTHGVGPVATMLNINRGNRFVALTSTATKSRGLNNYIVEQGGADHPNADIQFRLGDIVTTVIRCANGETVVVSHDTNLPRPYSLNFRVQGTRGLWMRDNRSIYLEGISQEPHQWEPFDSYQDRYDHPLWKRYASDAEGAGHGGMDFFVIHAFVESVKRKVAPPIDVYDAAAWSVVSPLSEQSIANGSDSVDFPDFTAGRWRTDRPRFGYSEEY